MTEKLVMRASGLAKKKFPGLKMPSPEFNLARLREKKPTGLLSRVERKGRVGVDQVLVNELSKPEDKPFAFAVIKMGPGQKFAGIGALPPAVAQGLDEFTRREFQRERSFWFHSFALVKDFTKPISMTKPVPGRRFASDVDVRDGKAEPVAAEKWEGVPDPFIDDDGRPKQPGEYSQFEVPMEKFVAVVPGASAPWRAARLESTDAESAVEEAGELGAFRGLDETLLAQRVGVNAKDLPVYKVLGTVLSSDESSDVARAVEAGDPVRLRGMKTDEVQAVAETLRRFHRAEFEGKPTTVVDSVSREDVLNAYVFVVRELRNRGEKVEPKREIDSEAMDLDPGLFGEVKAPVEGEERFLSEDDLREFGYEGEEIEKGLRAPWGSPGGKRWLAHTIASLLPEHKKYVEPFCFPSGTEVSTENGWIPINKLTVRDCVLTRNGFKPIGKIFARKYSGDLVSLRIKGDYRPMLGTPNHRVLVVRECLIREVKQTWNSGRVLETPLKLVRSGSAATTQVRNPKLTRQRARAMYRSAEWIPIRSVRPGDWVVQHFDFRSQNAGIIGLPKIQRRGSTRDRLPYVAWNGDLCRLVGLYLAEGSLDQRGVVFTLHSKEKEFIQFIRNVMMKNFQTAGRVATKKNNKSVDVRFSTLQAKLFFENFGRGAKNKFIPPRWKRLPREREGQLLRGILEGDGCYVQGEAIEITTVSERLAADVYDLLVRQGSCPSITRNRINTTLPNGQRYSGIAFKVAVTGDGRQRIAKILGKSLGWPKQRYLGTNLLGCGNGDITHAQLRKVQSVGVREGFAGDVYNLQVVGDPSYVTRLATVHNCGGAAVFWAKEQSKKEFLADIDGELVEAIKFIRDFTEPDFKKLSHLPFASDKTIFDRLKKTNVASLDRVEVFHRWLYLRRFSYASRGETETYCDPAKSTLKHVIGNLYKLKARLKGVGISRATWKETLKKHDSKDTLFYLDPPYAGTTVRAIEGQDGDIPELSEMAKILGSLRGNWILSHVASADVRKTFAQFHIRVVSTRASMAEGAVEGATRKELLISNLPLRQIKKFNGPEDRRSGFRTPLPLVWRAWRANRMREVRQGHRLSRPLREGD